MILKMMALLLAWGQGPPPPADASFEKAASSCSVDGERLRAVTGFFELTSDQTIAEYQPGFVLTGCLADAVSGRGKLIAVVDGGDRIVQVSRRLAAQKAMKRDVARYGSVPLVAIRPGKPVPVEHSGSIDRILISGEASDLLRDPKRGAGLLRLLRELATPAGLLGILDVPDAGGIDVEKLSSLARQAGWDPAGQMITGPGGLLLLKFRKS